MVRLAGVLIAAVICAASAGSGGSKGGGSSRTEKTGVFYTTKPRFEWPHRKGSNYRVVLWRIPQVAGQQRVAVYDQVNWTERTWIPPDDLDFQTRYELFIYNDAMQIVTSWGFTIGFQPPSVIYPEKNAKVRNLSPEIRIVPFDYPYVYYGFEISQSPNFEKVVDSGYIQHNTDTVRVFSGKDNELGTGDDVKFVAWATDRVLKPNATYYYRVRGYYFGEGDFANKGTDPVKENAEGKSEVTGSFTIPPQSGSDSLANVTQITRDSNHTGWPSLSKRLDLAYVMELPNDSGMEIRVAGVQVQKGVPVFDTGREEFTKSVKGSEDVWPMWDVDGEGLFFASNRSAGVANIWYKRRDARGYTQLTFHNVPAMYPTVSKDGNKVAYMVKNSENAAGWSVWTVGRDGRSATELGSGEQPKFSPDGKKIAFSQRDFNGVNQIWTMDTSGGNRVQITNEFCIGCNGNEHPVWHPSGQRLVFISDTKTGNKDIWMVELEGARMVQLTNYLGVDETPEFTPDGRYILFASTRGGDVLHIWMGEFAAN